MGLIEQLEELARITRETTGASFYITCNKSGIWQISLPNANFKTNHIDLETCINDAIKSIINLRTPTELPQQRFKL